MSDIVYIYILSQCIYCTVVRVHAKNKGKLYNIHCWRVYFDAHIKSEYRTVQLKAADTTEGVDWIKVIGVGGYSCLPYHM